MILLDYFEVFEYAYAISIDSWKFIFEIRHQEKSYIAKPFNFSYGKVQT